MKSKKKILLCVGISIVIVASILTSIIYFNNNGIILESDYNNDPSRVLAHCAQQKYGEENNWKTPDGKNFAVTSIGLYAMNKTHYIDNNLCTWIERPTGLNTMLSGDELKFYKQKLLNDNPEEIELEELQQMTCNEIIEYNYSGITYLSKDNRNFARNQVDVCIDMQEDPMRYGHCSTIALLVNTHQNYINEDIRTDYMTKLAKCVINGETEFNEIPFNSRIEVCEKYHDKENFEACAGELGIQSEPWFEKLSIEEVYQLAIDNEKMMINAILCSDLYEKYDGKMEKVHWDIQIDLIKNAFSQCKLENEN